MVYIILWTVIFLFLALYLAQKPLLRSWAVILWHDRKWKIWLLSILILVSTICLIYKQHPLPTLKKIDESTIFHKYYEDVVHSIISTDKITLSSTCDLKQLRPELVYTLPLIVNTYYEVVDERPTKPIISRLDDTLQIQMNGYKLFVFRGGQITKLLKNRLGYRYPLKIISNGSKHTLQITYTGEPWDTEQLLGLPVMHAASKHHLDPALLMSLTRHVSNFNFNYQGSNNTHGILALDKGKGLEQLYIGAERLGKQLQIVSVENAIATFYPDQETNATPGNWMQSPLTKSWVNQVMEDIQFYRENGLDVPLKQ